MGVGGDGGHTIGARGDQQGVRAHIRAAGKVLGGDDRQTHDLSIIVRFTIEQECSAVISSELCAPIAIFRDLSVFSPQKIIRGPSPHLGTMLKTAFSPLSFGKSFMKICSAVPENGCLIFMHYRCGGRR